MDKKRENTINLVYRPTQNVFNKIVDIENIYQMVENKHKNKKGVIQLPKKTMLGGLEAMYLTFNEHERKCSTISVHWKPNPKMSRQADPFCAIAILRYNTLCKLERVLINMVK